ncbi:type II toxin-antitoxin system VapC family toxin [Desulfobacter vibrioformis]|uniref:type II toxin-antitoxin system VapC family toxin n=1 Tax=Desulfobacter vibrioformis TaxID=34031 RepID=UPI000554E8A6|nr:type II toxin-antitoxin system VapC family toxin [Desulfobacter vibrioformis]
MAQLFLPDTDVLIDFLRGYQQAVDFINVNASQIILSTIVIAELYAGVRGKQELTILNNFVSLFDVIPMNSEIAKIGGLYKRDFGKSHGVGLADAIIAATCHSKNAQLKTLNIKHYPMIENLEPAYTKN